MTITRLSRQAGRRYGQMGGSLLIVMFASIGTTGTIIPVGQSPHAARYRWGYHDSTVYR